MATMGNIGFQLNKQFPKSVNTNSFCPIFRSQVGVVLAYAYGSTAALISAARAASGLAEGDIAPGCIVLGATTGTISTPLWVNTAANNSCAWSVFDQ